MLKLIKTGNEPYLDDKTIVFPKASCTKIKNKSQIILELTESDFDLIDLTKDFLLKISLTDRNNGYSLLIPRISELYLGRKLTQTDYRHLHSTEDVNFIDPGFIEKYNKLKAIAAKHNHSLDVMLEYYIDKVIKN